MEGDGRAEGASRRTLGRPSVGEAFGPKRVGTCIPSLRTTQKLGALYAPWNGRAKDESLSLFQNLLQHRRKVASLNQ